MNIEAEVLRAENRRRLYTFITLILTVSILVFGFRQADGMNSGGFWQGLAKFFDYPSEIVREAWQSGIGFFGLIWRFLPALIETLNIALVATLLGGMIAMVLSFLSTRNLDVPGWLVVVVRRAMDVMRAFPELIIALFLIFIVGSSPVPAMIAVAFHTSGALGKLFAEVTENADMRPVEGLRSVGANWVQRIRFGLLPQVAPNFISYFLLRFEINVRASAILGFVGAGGIGTELARTIGWGQGSGDETAALFVLLFLAIFVIDQVSSQLREHLTGARAARGTK